MKTFSNVKILEILVFTARQHKDFINGFGAGCPEIKSRA